MAELVYEVGTEASGSGLKLKIMKFRQLHYDVFCELLSFGLGFAPLRTNRML